MQALADVARRRVAAPLALPAAIGAAYLLAALLAAKQPRVTLVVVVLAAFAIVVAKNLGIAIGVLVLVVMNQIPGIDFEKYAKSGSFRVEDVAVFALVVILGARTLTRVKEVAADPWLRRARVWALAFVVWWAFTLIRSIVFGGVPLLKAALFGRDFLYFALVLPLFVGAIRSRHELRSIAATVLGGALLFVVGQIAIVFGFPKAGGIDFGWFVHQTYSSEFGGVERIYASIGDVVTACVPFGLGLALFGTSRRQRVLGSLLALATALSVLLALTRATYFAMFFGILFASALWTRSRLGGVGLRRAAAVLAALTLVVGSATSSTYSTSVSVDSSSVSPALIAARAQSGIQELSTRTGTIGYRYNITIEMRRLLAGHWATGLGFWHPAAHYVAALPEGSIRNGDVGVFNVLMTMGIVGAILLYLPLGTTVGAVVRGRMRRRDVRDEWFFYGVAAWGVTVLLSSISLITLFSTSGLVFVAMLLGTAALLLGRLSHERESNAE